MKKLFLFFALVLTICSTAMAQDGPAKNEIWYTSSDGNIVTPNRENFGGASIVTNVYDKDKSMYQMTFDKDVASIGMMAFRDCNTLTSIILPSGVTSIEQYPFYGCTSLTSITLPSELTSIGIGAFDGCTSLTSITLPSKLTSIGVGAFSYCTSLTSITLPNGVTSIERGAFYGCTSLTSINLPNTLESIGSLAFCGCSSLTSITLPSSLTEMPGGNQFMECSNLAYAKFMGTTPPSIPIDDSRETNPFYNSGIPLGGTILFVPNENAVNSFTAAGYKNVYVTPASVEEFKSQVLDEIDKALDGLELTPDDAALVTACRTSIGEATNFETILSNRAKALVPINLQKAKDAAIAYIDAMVAEQAENIKKYLEGDAVALWKERINSATDIGTIQNEQSLVKARIENIAVIVKTLIDAYISILNQETIEAIENHIRNIIESTDEYTPSNERIAATECTLSCFIKVVRFYLDPINDEDLIKTYLERIDEAIPLNSEEIFQIIEDAKKELYKYPYFMIDDNIYMPTPTSDYEYNFNTEYWENIYFPDGVKYESNSRNNIRGESEYTRSLPEGVWQCWYVPFTTYVDTEKFDAAEVADVSINAKEEVVVWFKKMENGAEMKPNTIYVIRAKEGHGELTIKANFLVLWKSFENKLTLQSAYENFTLTGNYSPKEHGDWYTLDKTGTFRPMASGYLKPQRFYLTITPREDGHYSGNQPKTRQFVNIMVMGDDENVTGITSTASPEESRVAYDLMGRKVTNIQKGQVYIKDGKKFFAK